METTKRLFCDQGLGETADTIVRVYLVKSPEDKRSQRYNLCDWHRDDAKALGLIVKEVER